jgi:hypothetical protein
MQMIVGILVLILIAVGVWWYMGSSTTEVTDTTTTDTVMEDDAMKGEGDAAMEEDTVAEETVQ